MYKQMKSEVKHRRLKPHVQVIKTGCTDRCKMGPIVAVMPKNEWHLQVSEEKAVDLVNGYLTPHP
ncbi:(2Fe-2S) ferredoxin domain-containing protein [Chryseolinea lacunae]|uniref:(2Fe-2S) ferredoxin domain-containing protein n=1 Tax=Chryseolinea lacunae TaxID=2801331 RepID=UPI001F1D772D|nr:(2Fe-2S) ferredoxin domain-containing protein [Chryseolinea lacunae]